MAGVKNKRTVERETLNSRVIGEVDRPLGEDILPKAMMEFRRLAASLRQKLGMTAHKLAPFESPRFAAALRPRITPRIGQGQEPERARSDARNVVTAPVTAL